MRQTLLYLALALILIPACSGGIGKKNAGQPQAFFGLKEYMQQETQQLSALQPRVLKRISIDGKAEEQVFDSLDYSKELAVFSRSDINKTAWFDKYRVDSTFQAGQLRQATYTALDEKLKTRLMEIEYDEGAVTSVHILNRTESLVADVYQDMYYRAGKGYSLMTKQSTALSDEKEIRVEVAFREL